MDGIHGIGNSFQLHVFLCFSLKKDLSLYIKNCELQVQEEALYMLSYTTLGKYKLQS